MNMAPVISRRIIDEVIIFNPYTRRLLMKRSADLYPRTIIVMNIIMMDIGTFGETCKANTFFKSLDFAAFQFDIAITIVINTSALIIHAINNDSFLTTYRDIMSAYRDSGFIFPYIHSMSPTANDGVFNESNWPCNINAILGV